MRQVGSLGAGQHVMGMEKTLPPGVYLLRLTQAGRTRAARGVVAR